jgi:DNA-binding transcriptional LysR family regulator
LPFTLRQLQYFIAVAERGSVSRAEQQLAISQSTVTEAIKALESDLGVRLFNRTGRGITLTQKGQRFERNARKVLSDVADARRELADDAGGESGQLHLGVTSLVAGYVLSDLLARYRRAFPALHTSVLEDAGEYLEHLLVNGEIDCAIVVTSNLHNLDALQCAKLTTSPYRLWLPLGHPLLAQEEVSLEQVAEEPLIQLVTDELEEAARRLWRQAGLKPNVSFRTRSVEGVRSLVATGAGIAVLPDLVYRPWSLEGDRIEARDIAGDILSVDVGLAWRRGSSLSRATENFIKLAGSDRLDFLQQI